MTTPSSRSGEFAKKSTRSPRRRLRRSHSSAETTTTAFLPLRVTSCGPSLIARATSSLKFARASLIFQLASRSATAHLPHEGIRYSYFVQIVQQGPLRARLPTQSRGSQIGSALLGLARHPPLPRRRRGNPASAARPPAP